MGDAEPYGGDPGCGRTPWTDPGTPVRLRRRSPLATLVLVMGGCGMLAVLQSCEVARQPEDGGWSRLAVEREVGAAVRAFHAADTARDAEAIVDMLWPEYEMLVDGERLTYSEVVEGTRTFMADVETFQTRWSDLRVIPLTPDAAVASFVFRDSIVMRSGEIVRSRGPTTLLWERRDGVWGMRFGDADHYPIER